jgi:O-antigen ligase
MFLLGSSRGSVVALLLSIPLFIVFFPFKQKVKFVLVSILLVPIISFAISFTGSSIVERILNTKEDKGGGRNVLWDSAINHFSEHPIIGGKIEIGGIYPHNLILETLMATGVLGLFLILPVIIKGFQLGYRMANINRNNLFVLLIMINGFVQHFFTGGFYTSIMLFTPLALGYSFNNRIQ